MRQEDKQKILVEVSQRMIQAHQGDPELIEKALIDTLYFERQRLSKEPNRKKAHSEQKFYDYMQKKALKGSTQVQQELLRQLVQRFADEILGHFSPFVYKLASTTAPPALNLLLKSASPLRLPEALLSGIDVGDQMQISGQTQQLKSLAKRGTVVLVPTHISNLDSILVGYGLNKLGLPPFTYGAGYNLFANKFMGFFMRNLGAYKVDRKKKAPLYKDVLKTYAGCSIEMGYHNLFFPGGTRSRSGLIEAQLKKGLLGTALDAYIQNLRTKKQNPDVFVIPCTLNYQLVLEAETLIADYLKEVGQNRYIIEDDEFSKPKLVIDFVTKLFNLDSRIHFVLGQAMDVFGNPVDDQGISYDQRGRVIARDRYVLTGQDYGADGPRDHEFVSELAEQIVGSFHRDSVLYATNVVCYTVFGMLKDQNPDIDLYRLLRTGGRSESFPLVEVYQRLEHHIYRLKELEAQGIVCLDQTLKQKDLVMILGEALAHLSTYHLMPAIRRRGDRLFHQDRQLIYYYRNRMHSYDKWLQRGNSR